VNFPAAAVQHSPVLASRAFMAFVATIPFLHALAPGPWLPLPMLVAGLALLVYLALGQAQRYVYFETTDLLLAVTLALGVAAFVLRPGAVGQKNINHTAALIVSVGLFYFWVRAWLRVARVSLEQVGAAALVGLLVASLAVITEFGLINTTGLYFSDLIPYSADELPQIDVLTDLKRPRGLAAEPGFTAMVFEALAPLSWLYLRRHRYLVLPAALLVLPGFLLLFSAGAILSVVLAFLLILVFRARSGTVWAFAGVIIAAIAAFAIFSDLAGLLFEQVVGRKLLDLIGAADATLAETASRYDAYTTAATIFAQQPFGIGWGTVSEMFASGAIIPGVPQLNSRGVMSLYLEVLVSAGLAGLLCFAAFLLLKLKALARRSDPQATLVLLAALTVMIHHAAVLEFWFPMLWLLLALGDYIGDSSHARAMPAPGPIVGGLPAAQS